MDPSASALSLTTPRSARLAPLRPSPFPESRRPWDLDLDLDRTLTNSHHHFALQALLVSSRHRNAFHDDREQLLHLTELSAKDIGAQCPPAIAEPNQLRRVRLHRFGRPPIFPW